MREINEESFLNDANTNIWLFRIGTPIATTTLAQFMVGPFLGAKADMQYNPHIKMFQAIKNRYKYENRSNNFFIGISNVYRGNFWNFSYVLGNALIGNNIIDYVNSNISVTNNLWLKSLISGMVAGAMESAWTTPLVSRELHRTTFTQLPMNTFHTYKIVYPPLVLRDMIGWIVARTNASLIQEKEKYNNVSQLEKITRFVCSGIVGATLSAPFDANLRRIYSEQENPNMIKVFIKACKQYGFFSATAAGWKGRILSVAPPMIANAVTQYYISNKS